MEEKKLSEYISLFNFVKQGMIKSEKTWSNLIYLFETYNKNKNLIIYSSNYRIRINNSEFKIPTKTVEINPLVEEPKLEIISIVAYGSENQIAINGKIPWRQKNDMIHFKNTTKHEVILMGRKTFETFEKPLPNRIHLIISKDEKITKSNDMCYYFTSIESAIEFTKNKLFANKIYIIGGGEIYKQTIDIVDKIIVTRIKTGPMLIMDDEVTYFPKINMEDFKITERDVDHNFDDFNDYPYGFFTYERKKIDDNTNEIKQIFINVLSQKIIVNYFLSKK